MSTFRTRCHRLPETVAADIRGFPITW